MTRTEVRAGRLAASLRLQKGIDRLRGQIAELDSLRGDLCRELAKHERDLRLLTRDEGGHSGRKHLWEGPRAKTPA